MADVFGQILHLSFVGSWVILVVLLARLLLRKSPKWCSYLLWGVVFVRLVLPVFPVTGFSLIPAVVQSFTERLAEESNLIEESMEQVPSTTPTSGQLDGPQQDGQQASADMQMNQQNSQSDTGEGQSDKQNGQSDTGEVRTDKQNGQSDTGIGQSDKHKDQSPVGKIWSEQHTNQSDTGEVKTNNYKSLGTVLAYLWAIGVLAFGSHHTRSYWRFKKQVLGATLAEDGVYELKGGHLSFILGIFKPAIYLSGDLTEESRRVVLCHEQVHLARRDYLWKSIALAITCIHWFNPLVWLVFHLFNKDCEMSCDEKVVSLLGEGSKKVYSYALLDEATGGERLKQKKENACAVLSFGEKNIKTRIKHVLDLKKTPKWVIVCTVAVLAVLILGLMSNRGKEQSDFAEAGLSKKEAEHLHDVGAILQKMQEENLVLTEVNGAYQVVDEAGNIVKKTADIKASQIRYIIKAVREYNTQTQVSYATMLQDLADRMLDNPEQDSYRVTYDNGFWLEADIDWEKIDADNNAVVGNNEDSGNNVDSGNSPEDNTENLALDEELSCINTPYPNEVEICNFPNGTATPGLYTYRCELRLYTGLYYLQSYMLQQVNIIKDSDWADIVSIQNGCASAGALEIISSDECINVKYAKSDSKVWGEAELQTTCKVSDVIQVPLTDPFSNTAVEGHNWTCYTVFRTIPQEVRVYGASYGVTDQIEKPVFTMMVDWAGYQFDDAVAEATTIVWGKVKEIGKNICTSHIASDGSYLRDYYKEVKIEVLESLKGEHAQDSEITYMESGGETGRAIYVYTGVQEVEPGQEYIFFLGERGFALSPVTVIPVKEGMADVKGKIVPESFINPTYVKPVPDEVNLSEYLYATRRAVSEAAKASAEEKNVLLGYEPLAVNLEGLSVTDYLARFSVDSFETPYVSLGPVEGLSYVYHREENTYQENAYWDSVSIYYQGVRCGYFVTQDLYPMLMRGVTNWQSELGLEVIMESMGFRGAANLQEHVSVGDMERYYYAGGKQAYVYGDTEWLVEEGFLNSIEEALDEKVEEAAIVYGKDHSTEGYLLRLYKSMISEEKIAALLEAITFKEGAFNVENMDIVLAHKDGVPSFETTQRDVWSYENQDKMAYYIALGDLTYRVPQGTVAILRDESRYDLYVYTHDGTGGIRIGTIYVGDLLAGMTAGSEVWEEPLFTEEQQKILADRENASGLIKQTGKYIRETFVTEDGKGVIQVERMIFTK